MLILIVWLNLRHRGIYILLVTLYGLLLLGPKCLAQNGRIINSLVKRNRYLCGMVSTEAKIDVSLKSILESLEECVTAEGWCYIHLIDIDFYSIEFSNPCSKETPFELLTILDIICKWKWVVVAQIIWMILSSVWSTMRDMSTLKCRLLLDPPHPLHRVVVKSSPSLALSCCWILPVHCFGYLLNPPHPLVWFLADSSHPLLLVIKYAICTWMFPMCCGDHNAVD